MLYKVSIRPNADMKRQAERLKNLEFDERDIFEIMKEQFFYKRHEDNTSNKNCCKTWNFSAVLSCNNLKIR